MRGERPVRSRQTTADRSAIRPCTTLTMCLKDRDNSCFGQIGDTTRRLSHIFRSASNFPEIGHCPFPPKLRWPVRTRACPGLVLSSRCLHNEQRGRVNVADPRSPPCLRGSDE